VLATVAGRKLNILRIVFATSGNCHITSVIVNRTNDNILNTSDVAARLVEVSTIIFNLQQNGFVRPLENEKTLKFEMSDISKICSAFQDEAVEWMKTRELDSRYPGGFLCHEMGLGKTRMMCRLIKESIRQKTLVLTTKSTLGGWLHELREQSKFEFDILEYKSGHLSRPLDPSRPAVIVGTHHSVLKGFPFSVDRLIIDEAHIMRSGGELYTAFKNIPSHFRWGMTATPYNNKADDIKAYTSFLKHDLPASAFRYFMLRKTRAEVFPDGPSIRIHKYIYDFETPQEKSLYDFVAGQIESVEEWIAANRGRVPTHVLGAIGFTIQIRKRQAAIHPQIVLDAEKTWRHRLGDSGDFAGDWKSNVTKFKHIFEMVKSDQSKGKSTMIVTHFERELQLLRENLTAAGIPVDFISGKTKAAERRELELVQSRIDICDALKSLPIECVAEKIASFVSPPRVVLLQIKAGGVGLSLPWIHHVINTSPDWNPFMELQAMYRAYRITTKHDVDVTNMYFKETIDTHIQKTQSRKLEESLEWTGDVPESIASFLSMPNV
jgi:SNF2 family DNA or RNA helicase